MHICILAGNTATSNAISSHAPMLRVASGMSNSANTISNAPLAIFIKVGAGSHGGIMRMYHFGFIKWLVPAATYTRAIK